MVAAEKKPAGGDVRKPRTARERFGSRGNPFATRTQGVVTRSAEFRRIAALPRRTRWEDNSVLVTAALARPPLPPGSCPPDCPCDGSGFMTLRPHQAWALSEFYARRGGLGILGVGAGKTLISLLVPTLLGWQRGVLLVPAALRDKSLDRDFPLLSRHWKILPRAGAGDPREAPDHPAYAGTIDVRSYEELGRQSYADYLSRRRVADGVVADEVHRLKNRRAGVTKRTLRHYSEIGTCEFVGMSGSVVHRSVMDYGHLLNLALREGSPVPLGYVELRTWADVVDEDVPEFSRPKPGAIFDFCRAGESPRDGYRRRVLETEAVVATQEMSCSAGIIVEEEVFPDVPDEVKEAFRGLRNHGELPGGEVAAGGLEQQRRARELLCGFYYRWIWPDNKPDKEWLKKRRAWRKYVRKMTTRSHDGVWLDTEAQVVQAVKRGDIVCSEQEVDVKGQVVRDHVNVYEEWVEVREARRPLFGGKPEPAKEAVWVSNYFVDELLRWASKHTGDEAAVVWIESVALLDALRAKGAICYAAGQNECEIVEQGDRTIFCSTAHATGKNFHRFHRMLFSTTMQSGEAWEQALGREHRSKQKADDVIATVYVGCRETWWALERSRIDAKYIEETLGQVQRLNRATFIVKTSEAAAIERCDAGDPLWAETGDARIDGKLGRVREDGEREASRTPILDELKAQAKEQKKNKKNKKTSNKRTESMVDEVDKQQAGEDA